jgi:hypothetical protein
MKRIALAALFASALPLVTGVALARDPSGTAHHAGATEVLGYEKHLMPIVSAGGQVVEQSMKPALRDFRYDHVTPPAFMATEAEGWIAALSSARSQVAAIKAQPELAAVSQGIADALDRYGEAARYFRSAFLAEAGPAREQLLAAGLSSARSADHLYDRAASRLQRIRHRLGLPTDPYFPGGAHE